MALPRLGGPGTLRCDHANTRLVRGFRARPPASGQDPQALGEHEERARERRARACGRAPRPSRPARAARGRSGAGSRSAARARRAPSASSSARPRAPSRGSSIAEHGHRLARARSPRRSSAAPWARRSGRPARRRPRPSRATPRAGPRARMPASTSACSARSASSGLIIEVQVVARLRAAARPARQAPAEQERDVRVAQRGGRALERVLDRREALVVCRHAEVGTRRSMTIHATGRPPGEQEECRIRIAAAGDVHYGGEHDRDRAKAAFAALAGRRPTWCCWPAT